MNKQVFGWIELVFDAIYLSLALLIGLRLISGAGEMAQRIAAAMALVLVAGDAFHLVPRMLAVATGRQAPFERMMGVGKFITSLTMTVFYLLLLETGVRLTTTPPQNLYLAIGYALAAIRIALCLFPQNRWLDNKPAVRWGIWRNVPFLLLGLVVAVFYFRHAATVMHLQWVWLTITLSFAFYLPVVLWVHKERRLGMLMLPKSCAYLWILYMFERVFA